MYYFIIKLVSYFQWKTYLEAEARSCSIPLDLPYIPWPAVVIYLVLFAVGMPSINVNTFLSKISIVRPPHSLSLGQVAVARNDTHQTKWKRMGQVICLYLGPIWKPVLGSRLVRWTGSITSPLGRQLMWGNKPNANVLSSSSSSPCLMEG